jgi:hypothetical protein
VFRDRDVTVCGAVREDCFEMRYCFNVICVSLCAVHLLFCVCVCFYVCVFVCVYVVCLCVCVCVFIHSFDVICVSLCAVHFFLVCIYIYM